jgi:hypothetical protein
MLNNQSAAKHVKSNVDDIEEEKASSLDKNKVRKICGICGKRDDFHMPRHFRTHPLNEPSLWDGVSHLTGEPWCQNWQDVLFKGSKPIGALRTAKQK